MIKQLLNGVFPRRDYHSPIFIVVSYNNTIDNLTAKFPSETSYLKFKSAKIQINYLIYQINFILLLDISNNYGF